MDEAEKYKQRMEAIAEKRRQLEEQERAKREMEDEKLRLQQLKRKSLRDQWLMEGAPLSPASPDPQVPRSPLWGSQAAHNENQRWPSETQQLAGEEEKLREQVADGQTEAVEAAEDEVVQDAVVQNGDSNAVVAETVEHEVKTSQIPALDEVACVLTNGKEEEEEEEEEDTQPHVSGDSSEQNTRFTTNGPLQASESAAGAELEAGSGLDVSEEGLGHIPNNSINVEEEEEEEGTLVMRAECVIITDEGDDDATHELPPREDEPRTEEDLPEPTEEGGDEVEEMIKADVATETLLESGKCVAAEPAAEPPAGDGAAGDGAAEGDLTEHKDEIKDKAEEAPELLQSNTDALEGAPVAPVPVYSESQPPTTDQEPEAAAEAPAAHEEPEAAAAAAAALKAEEGPPPTSGQFQEVPLADAPRENQRTEEQPLLSQAKAPADAQAEADATAATTETRSANTQEAPKQKSCQCCTVM